MARPQPAQDGTAPYDAIRPTVAGLLDQRAYKHALTLLQRTYRSMPPDTRLLDDMATCYWELGDAQTALQLVELAATDGGGDAATWGRLGAMALSTGDRERAQSAFRRALSLSPRDARALAALNRVAPLARDSRQMAHLRDIARSAKATPNDRAIASNTLGLIEQAAGNTKAAFHHFARAKAHKPGRYDTTAADEFVAEQRERYHPDLLRLTAKPLPHRFVFVVGMPRSGTTLVESILTRHPQVTTIGESIALQDCMRLCRHRTGQKRGWDWMDAITPELASTLAQTFLDRCAQKHVGEFPEVIVDKTPLNLFEAGFARAILPDARFVFMSRHPLDVGLSNFTTNYAAPHPFSKSLATIGHMTRTVFTSAGDYQSKLGQAFRWQSFRALVTSPETQIRAMLDHLGLAWDDRCLAPQDRTGAVNTASFLQVRSAINDDGLGKWHRFEAELAPLVQALGGQKWIEDWAAKDTAAAG
ncbi:sulfotransferase [Sulfitobacter sp. HNIBRBA3233]|uniref:tetratricopeptide repeat-containing sulfotransferase family protein n=1 Tax=Sulfitobacter marinivivus TaxID=3158558 RepID=UPI0032DF45AE